jgi:chromosome segregation ATPase
MDWTAIAIALVGGGALVSFINGCFQRRKLRAEAAAIDAKVKLEVDKAVAEINAVNLGTQVDAFIKLVERLEGRIDKLHCRVEVLEADIEGRDMVIAKLTEENRDLKGELQHLKEQNQRLMKTNQELTKRVKALEDKLKEVEDC